MNKWNSRRWWICVWAVVMTTALIIYLMISRVDAGWVGTDIALFQVIIGGYIAADSMTKPRQ